MWFWLREQSYFFYFWNFCGHFVCVCVCPSIDNCPHQLCPQWFKITEEKIPKSFGFSIIIFQCKWDDTQILQTEHQEKVPESTWVRFHDAKVAELQKTTCKKGHLTLHGPPSNSWGSTAICQDSCMSVFHRCVFRESLPRNETCDDDVWDCGRAFLQVCEWTEPPALNPPSAENNERPASSFWFWRWPLWKWWVMSQTYTSEKVYHG